MPDYQLFRFVSSLESYQGYHRKKFPLVNDSLIEALALK
jgi:hypothetical protein